MFKDTKAFPGFSVKDIEEAKTFYEETLGLDVEQDEMGLTLHLSGGLDIFVYPKENHQPASFTILNFVVDDIDKAIDDLTAAGVTMERYEGMPAEQDEKGVMRGKAANQGPDIAWFEDPSGNVLAVLQN